MIARGLARITLNAEDVLNELSDRELSDLYECLAKKMQITELIKEVFSLPTSALNLSNGNDREGITRDVLVKKIIEHHGTQEFKELPLSIYNCAEAGTPLEKLIKSILIFKLSVRMDRLHIEDYTDDILKQIKESCFTKNKDLLNFLMCLTILGSLQEGLSKIESLEARAILSSELLEQLFEYYALYQEKRNRRNQVIITTATGNCEKLEKEKQLLSERYEKEKKLKKNAESKANELAKKIEEMLKTPGNPELMHKMQESLDKKDRTIEGLIKDFREAKGKPSKINDSLIESLTREKAVLKVQSTEKANKIRELSAELKKYSDMSAVVRNYLSSVAADENVLVYIPENVQQFIYQSLQAKVQTDDPLATEEIAITEDKNQVDEVVVPKNLYKIGACILENGMHYIMFPDGDRQEIENLYETTYLTNGQLVRVNMDNKFVEAYSAITEDVKKESNNYFYGPVVMVGGVPHIERGRGNISKIIDMASWIALRHGQIVSVGQNNNLKRFYKPVRLNLDNFYDSMRFKGHHVAYVLKKIAGLYLTRDIETEEEQLLGFVNDDTYEIQEQELIVYKENEILKVFVNSKLYTKSKYYSKACYATVEQVGDDALARKFNKEVVIVRGALAPLQVGQVIRIDEFGNFLDIAVTSEDMPQGLNSKIKPKKPQEDLSDRPEKTILSNDAKTVAIIGNIKMQEAYRQALSKEGYKACMVDGFKTYSSVKREINGSSIIIIVAKYVSHDNWWSIKKDYPEEKYRLSDHDGANRIVELVNSVEKVDK